MSYTLVASGQIDANGSVVVRDLVVSGVPLLINILSAPTGGSPTITFTITEVDAADETTSTGNAISTDPLDAVGVYSLLLRSSRSTTCVVSWVLGGSTPVFPNVTVTVSEKIAAPLTTDSIGNALTSITNHLFGTSALVDPYMALRAAPARDEGIGGPFDDNIYTDWWDTAGTGSSGSVTVLNGAATVASGTAADGVGFVQGRYGAGGVQLQTQSLVYRAGLVYECAVDAKVNNTGVVDNLRSWGVATVDASFVSDGAFFRLNGTTFEAVVTNNGVETAVASGSWTGEAFTLDTEWHEYEVFFTPARAWFVIDGELRHTIEATEGLFARYEVPRPYLISLNLGATTNCTIQSRRGVVMRLGEPAHEPDVATRTNQEAVQYAMGTGSTQDQYIAVGAQFDDASPTVPTENQVASLRMSSARGLHTNLRTGAGVELLGQQTMAASLPVTLASNQSALPVTAASLPLPTGAATETTLSSVQTTLASAIKAPAAALSNVATLGAYVDETAPGTAAENSVDYVGQTSTHALYTAIRDGRTTGSSNIGARVMSSTPDAAEFGLVVRHSGTALVDGSAVTQPVSAASLPLPTGAATSANQSTEITSLQLLDDTVHSPNDTIAKMIAIGGQLDDASTVVATENNVSALRVNAQRGLHTNLRQSDGSELLGQKTKAGSVPVVLASDTDTLAISAASLPLPTGASTLAEQQTQTTALQLLDDVVHAPNAALSKVAALGASDGTNVQAARLFDLDSGGGTEYTLGVNLRKIASGGSVEAGTSADPLRIDPTGTTTQPVSDASGSLTVDAPVGTPVFTRLSDGSAALVGQKTMANSLPVVVASDQTNLPTNVAQVGGTNVVTGGVSGLLAVAGNIAHDSPIGTANPVRIGGKSRNALPTAVSADDDVVDHWVDRRGRLHVATDDRASVRLGIHYAHVNATILQTAHGATAGFMWLFNASGSGVIAAIRKLRMSVGSVANTAFTTGPRVLAERMTFTGTPSGTQVTPALRDSTETAAVATVRTASTGTTPSAGAVFGSVHVPPAMTAVGAANANVHEDLIKTMDDAIILREGEGLVIRQADNGTASDTRRLTIDLVWEEYT